MLAVMLLAQAAALLLHGGEGSLRGTASSGRLLDELILFVNDAITLSSLRTRSIADVRDAVLPLAAGCALALVALDRAARRRAGATPLARDSGNASPAHGLRGGDDTHRPADGERSPAERWFLITAAATAIIAVLSTIQAGSHDFSWGWTTRFVCGAALAWATGRLIPPGSVRAAWAGLLIVGVICLALSTAYRHSRGHVYFSWPIGALTPLAVAAGTWAAAGLAGGLGLALSRSRDWRMAALSLAATAPGCYVVAAAQRRAALLGVAAALGFFGWTRLSRRLDARTGRLVSVAVIGLAFLAVAGYGVVQLNRADRVAAGAVAVRLEYWRAGLGMVAAAPSLGIGPDMTVVRLTNAVAPQRDVSPHVVHGNIDPAFHNEWLQAVVELGLPGGLFYALLPAGTLLLARRQATRLALDRVRPGADGELARRVAAPPAVDALSAALVALCVADAASVTLRGPILPVLYWSILGLLLAAAPGTAEGAPRAAAAAHRGRYMPVLVALLAAAGCWTAGVLDLVRATAPMDRLAGPRLYAERTIADRMQTAIDTAAQGRWDEAAEALAPLERNVPGFRDVSARYAEALIRLDRRDEAAGVLRAVLSPTFRPHEPAANVLYARHFARDVREQLACIERALRHETVGDAMSWLHSSSTADNAEARESLAPRISEARGRVEKPEALAGDDDAPELFRLSAALLAGAGDVAGALADQSAAARAYETLERLNHRYRRGHRAEFDAFRMLAEMLYSADGRHHAAAFEAIRKAERYAVMGLRHERVWPPRPAEGYVFGEVMPVEFPEELRPMWRFSAKMQMIAGINENLDLRVYFSLPPQWWMNEEALYREIGALAAECVRELKLLPPGERPRSYNALVETAKKYGTARM